MQRNSSLYRLFITWFFAGLFLSYFVCTVCNVSISVRNGSVQFVSTNTSADTDFFQDAGTDRSLNFTTARHTGSYSFVPLLAFIPAKEGSVDLVPVCSFFLSETFYIFLTSLAP